MKITKPILILLAGLLLLCCSHAKKNPIDEAQKYAEDAIKARKSGPLEGDVRVMDGVEFIYGRNVKYMSTSGEPLYVWLRRDLYTPSMGDLFASRVGTPTIEQDKLQDKLNERLAKIEQTVRGGGEPQTARPPQPVKDAAGRTWTRYLRNDDGIEWFLDQGPPLQPSHWSIQLWRKRAFPSWAFQKEIVTLDELNCREARYRTHELRVSYWDGKTQTSDKATPWANVFTESPEEYLMNEYCK